MADKKADTKKLRDTIDKTIHKLEARQAELKSEVDPKTGKLKQRAKKELKWVEQHLSLMKSARDEVQEALERAKTEEEKKKVMNVVALAMLVGAVNENLRLSEEHSRRYTDPELKDQSVFELVAHALFSSKEFKFVTEADVADIIMDEELMKMAIDDPDKLNREEKDVKAEYETMMTKTLKDYGLTVGEDFAENEARFRKAMTRNNGFEFALSRSGEYIRNNFITTDKEIDKADRSFFIEVLDEIEDLSKITREIQEKYILEEYSFDKGNGYTEELLYRELALVKKLEAFSQMKLEQFMDMDPNSEEYKLATDMYERSQMMVTPIKNQHERDAVLQRNNDLRRRMERWMVYQQLPDENRPEILKESVEIQNRKASVAKLRRMERAAVRSNMEDERELSEEELKKRAQELREGHGGLLAIVSAWTVEETENLLERLESDEPLKKQDRPEVRRVLAMLVLSQMISDDMRRPTAVPAYFKDRSRLLDRNYFDNLTTELAESQDFRKVVDPLLKGQDMKESVYRFLANDFEKDSAKKLYKLTIERRMKEEAAAPEKKSEGKKAEKKSEEPKAEKKPEKKPAKRPH